MFWGEPFEREILIYNLATLKALWWWIIGMDDGILVLEKISQTKSWLWWSPCCVC